jgi:hypothetical protein
MRRTALAIGVVLALALPAGLAMAKPARTGVAPAPKAHAGVGGKTKRVKVGNSTIRAHTRPTKGRANTSRPASRKKPARSTGGGSVGVKNSPAGSTRVGILQRKSGATGVSLGGKSKGTPFRGGVRL